jgi:hypothetical protein
MYKIRTEEPKLNVRKSENYTYFAASCLWLSAARKIVKYKKIIIFSLLNRNRVVLCWGLSAGKLCKQENKGETI